MVPVAVCTGCAIAAACLVPLLAGRQLRTNRNGARGGIAQRAALHGPAAAAGAVAGLAAGLCLNRRAGEAWQAPALLVWAVALAAIAVVDGRAHRVPTALARQATVLTLLLLLAAELIAGGTGTARALVTAGALGAVFRALVALAGVGRGDVRLAVLGGLGLGHLTRPGALAGGVAFTAAGLLSLLLTRRRTAGAVQRRVPLGPAMVAGFLAAAAF